MNPIECPPCIYPVIILILKIRMKEPVFASARVTKAGEVWDSLLPWKLLYLVSVRIQSILTWRKDTSLSTPASDTAHS